MPWFYHFLAGESRGSAGVRRTTLSGDEWRVRDRIACNVEGRIPQGQRGKGWPRAPGPPAAGGHVAPWGRRGTRESGSWSPETPEATGRGPLTRSCGLGERVALGVKLRSRWRTGSYPPPPPARLPASSFLWVPPLEAGGCRRGIHIQGRKPGESGED